MKNTVEIKNRRVLIIDDNRTIHDDFRKILAPGDAGRSAVEDSEALLYGAAVKTVETPLYEVDSAYQGQEGVARAKAALEEGRPYAMAFVDVRMPPGWDGIETAQRLWEITPDLQIVICTAYSDYSWGEMFEKIGNRDGLLILKKPFDAVEALQLAHALTEKWGLFQEVRRKMEELEHRVADRTRELQEANGALREEVIEHSRTEDALRLKTAFLEAQVASSVDGILVVDQEGKATLQNQRLVDLFKLPPHLAEEKSDENRLRWVTGMVKNPDQFLEKVLHLYANPNETSHDEIELHSGATLDRYSFPAIGTDGKYYGRIWTFRDITERKRVERQVRQSEARYRSLFDNARDAIFTIGPDGAFTSLNAAVEPLGGISRAEWLGKPFAPMVHPDDLALAMEMFKRTMQGEHTPVHALRGNPTLNRPATMEMTLVPQIDESGNVVGVLGVGRDITERKKFEATLFQSQKLETVGKLAGGIAHEFNSILTAIMGQSELLLSDLPADSQSANSAVEINRAASRAARLTRQLLAYGRKQFLQPEILDLNRVIAGMDGVFRLLMGGEVATQILPAPDLKTVKADAGQIEQVIMNMLVNARDAMPHGGKLTIETANVSFEDETVGRYPELRAGDYVMLAITDTGAGMSEKVKEHLFEPFFTTKGVGQGTGLGLSTCYGIIKQSGGHISAYSEVGRGSTFKIYLPQVQQQPRIPAPRPASPGLPSGTETILLVEDDPALREMATTLLRRLGYTVWAAANGIEALTLKQGRDVGHIDLLFTDVVMPHMSGKELADRVEALYPHTKILFTSAYTEAAIVHQGVLNKGVALLKKPFTPSALAHKVREVLEQRNPS